MTAVETLRINIKWLRHQYNLSQEAFGEVIGSSRPLVGSWEEGRSAPQYDHLISISDYFKVSIDDLLRVELSRWYVLQEVKVLAKLTIEE